MVLARQPIVETKALESPATTLANTLEFSNVYVPECYTQLEQGFGEHNIIGTSLFSKYLTMKLRLKTDTLTGSVNGCSITIYQGWCKAKMNTNANTVPIADLVKQENIVSHVEDQFQEIFTDRLAFGQKLEGIKILSKKVVHRKDGFSVITEDAGQFKNQDQFFTFTWKPMRKIHYTEGFGDMFYPNRDWIPFISVVYDVNSAATPTEFPQVSMSSKHWFTDS